MGPARRTAVERLKLHRLTDAGRERIKEPVPA
jgi:hypothetical protein